ncbi:leucine-rich-repeats and calponin homology domain protein isoform X2 [Lycorma delicatula]|uniref:leucine-rich-repeats and calponin homology domain protein isoform X2 n=1 Tax=Lycorma delicatula TaxID=130591 RepID=UPI003F518FBE
MAKVVSNMSGQLQNQLTRSLERILEEAHLSGELKLSGRKLRDFPRTGGKYDLADTVIADLSKNRFWELPEEVTNFWSMEKLLCYHNVIRSIPDSVVSLQSLVYLDLSRNHLTILPVGICQLPLEILLIANNKLTALPEELGRCKTLMELDVSCNQITHLPPQLGYLSSLRILNVRNNILLELPIEVTYLKLVQLDLSENRISTLPVELRTMTTLVSLDLTHNPLVSPPASVCMRGRVHVFKYLELRCAKEDKVRGGLRGADDRRGHRKLSDLRTRRCEASRWNGGNSTPSTLSPGDSGSITNSEEGLNDICKRRLERSSSEREVSRPNSSESGILSLPSSSLGSRFSKTSATTNGLSPTIEQTPTTNGIDSDSRVQLPVQSYREYKEALRQQRVVDNVYRPRTNNQSNENNAPTTNYVKEVEKIIGEFNNSQNQSPEHKRPVQKVIPSRNGNFSPQTTKNEAVNGVNNTGVYVKPPSPQLVTTSLGFLTSGNGAVNNAGTPNTPRPMAWNRNVPPDKLSFTMRREFEKAKEEAELISQLRTNIETRLKMALPVDLAPALCDGVVLCHLANHVRPRSVASIHVPSPAVPKLTMARCRRNVDNFLEACRRIGVEEGWLCRREDIIKDDDGRDGDITDGLTKDEGGLLAIARTVARLLEVIEAPPPPPTVLSTCLCIALFVISLLVLYLLPSPD